MVRSVRHSLSRRAIGVFASLLVMTSVVGGVGASPVESQTPGRLFDLFDADAPSDDWQNTYLLSLLSHYVYPGNINGDFETQFRAGLEGHGLSNFTFLDGGIVGTQGMIVETDDAFIVAIRGTEFPFPNDVATDLLIPPTSDGTHLGFRAASAAVLPEVAAALSNRPGKKVWFTGHSLGGAVAQDLALQLRESVTIGGVVTFGAPQIYLWNLWNDPTTAFGEYRNDAQLLGNTELWMNDRDPVPHLINLISGVLLQYARVGNEHHIQVDFSLRCSVSNQYPFGYGAGATLAADHDTHRYSTRIYNLMPARSRDELAAFGQNLGGGIHNPPLPNSPVARCDAYTPPADPSVTANVTGTLGNNGWYRSDVTVTWSTEDIPAGTPSQGCQTSTVRIDTTGRTIVCRYTLSGGQVVEGRVTIKRDTTPPETSVELARSPNSYGWYTSSVGYSTVGTDAASGIRSCSSERTYSGPDRASKLLIGVCHDQAGNRDTGYTRIKYDATAPTIRITTPKNGTSYRYGQSLVADYSCADSVGVTSCSGPVGDGKTISTKSTGKKSFKVTARDAAGNSRSVSHSYTVGYK